MKLEYKILWFDDQPDSAREMEKGISTRLARLGFQLIVEWRKDIKDVPSFLADLQRRNDVDLILMDWNLGANADNGAILAKKLRSKIFTEIVFYSSASPTELRKAIYDQDIDGVYCVRRDVLVADAMNVIKTTIKKILDINHMRGLVMGTVSAYDAEIELIMSEVCNRMKDNASVITHIKNALISQNESNAKHVTKLGEKIDINELLSHRSCTSFIKYRTLCALLAKKDDDLAIADLHVKLKDYQIDVLDPRNALAHAIVEVVDGKTQFKGQKDFTCDDNQMGLLRRNLLAHGDNLSDIRNAVRAGLFDDMTSL